MISCLRVLFFKYSLSSCLPVFAPSSLCESINTRR
jgi:hypothetical protein